MYDKNYLCLLTIKDSIDKIISFTDSFHNADEFYKDDKSFDDVMMNFVIIGEQTFKLGEKFKEKNPNVEWNKIKAFRNIIAHDYFGVDAEEVWGIIKKHIPILIKDFNELINKIKEAK